MFRILVVDDDPAAAQLLKVLMTNLQRPHEIYIARDGLEALDFLRRQGTYADAPRPNLVLLDLNMPRLDGVETLSAIKSDAELSVIPVIMLSAASSPEDVRRCYQAHANCYVQKPTNLERSLKLIQAVEAFWMDFALLSWDDGQIPDGPQSTDSKSQSGVLSASRPTPGDSGRPIAPQSGEASSYTSRIDNLTAPETQPRGEGCEEHNRLLDEFGVAVHELLKLHEQQLEAIVEGDGECNRFDLLIHMANEKKQLAKYNYLRHVESHGCSNTNAFNQTRT